jgi:exonuclease V
MDVMGWVEEYVVAGIIDEAELNTEQQLLYIRDTKTRVQRSMPNRRYAKTGQLQLALYHHLLQQMRSGLVRKRLSEMFSQLSVDADSKLQDRFCESVKDFGWQAEWHTLRDVALGALHAMEQLPPLADTVALVYEHQQSRQPLGSLEFCVSETDVARDTALVRAYWSGLLMPTGVCDMEDAWKCQRCEFADICTWRAQRAAVANQENAQQ